MWLLYSTTALVLAFVLDRIFGDPHWKYHPICIIGNLIGGIERKLRARLPQTEKWERFGGKVLVCFVCFIVFSILLLISGIAYKLNVWVYLAMESILCYFILAAKSLKTESMRVYAALKEKDTEGARAAVSMIVGRDTKVLDSVGITKAAVETVAENTSDGVIAPLLFAAIGGAPLGFLYKAINTMDSMVGYKNEKYINFGRAAAKTDDFVNFIPSRLSAVLMIAAAALCGQDCRNAARIFRRDRLKHASPNSAQTESVCAGALNVQLAGDAYYFGKRYKKDFIGDDTRAVEAEDIKRANRLMYTTAVITLVLVSAVKLILFKITR